MKPTVYLFALLVIANACGNSSAEENSTLAETHKSTPVYVKELQPSTFRHFISVLGDVESDKTILITPKAAATVEKLHVRSGDKVEQGAILATLDSKIIRNQIEQVETQLNLAETIYERQKNLREQNIGSEVEFLQAETQFESAKSQLAILKEQYANYFIKATISGTIDKVNLKVGEIASPQAAAFQLTNLDALKVTAKISETYITRVDPTDSVEIYFPSLNETINTKIDVVSKAINASNRTFTVEIYIPNASGNIRPNMMAKVKINDVLTHNEIIIPVNTLQIARGEQTVFVAQKTGSSWVAQSKKITTGLFYDNDLIIESGLNKGDLLITEGFSNLVNGAAISIQEN
ncbi:efflux RND transporter periplasmic adaptor subunit [bacterium]|nr:MAG: efflux RND transporter periplasmic adaptor subunit [bacterium]